MTRQIKFWKMDGTGNDFIIIDGRENAVSLSAEQVKKIADRSNKETGGCDQVIIIGNSDNADCFMQIYNADGGEVDACGNATRCVSFLIGKEKNAEKITIETNAGLLGTFPVLEHNMVSVDMGEAKTGWQDIPLSEERDTLHLGIEEEPLSDPVGVSMGNPHAVFFVDDVEKINLKEIGPKLEHHPLFPKRANIGVAEIDGDAIFLRVWERGVGETKSCGTGACAAVVAAKRRGLLDGEASVITIGGELFISIEDDGHVIMAGLVSVPKEGTLTL